MFGLFRKKSSKAKEPTLYDIYNNPLKSGDQVRSLRYDLGVCTLEEGENGYFYKSLDSGNEIHCSLMFDAISGRQKVEKIGI